MFKVNKYKLQMINSSLHFEDTKCFLLQIKEKKTKKQILYNKRTIKMFWYIL